MAEGLELKEATKNLSAATAELTRFNERAGVEIAKTIGGDLKKGVLDPFASQFAALPGVATLGEVGKTLFNKAFAALKERREQNLLRQRLGLTKDQFNQMKYQKKVLDAQAEYNKVLNEGAKNLLGFNQDELLATQQAANGQFLSISAGIDKLVGIQGDQVKDEQKRQAILDKSASKRIETENRAEREAQDTRNIFERIAGGIDNLAEGIQNIKAEDVGKGLLAPLGLIGGIIVSFVGGFVNEVRKQFNLLKAIFSSGGNLVKGFGKLLVSITNLVKAITPNFILNFFQSIKNTLTGMKTLLTGGLTKIGTAADIVADSTKIGDIFRSFRGMIGNVKAFFVNSKFFQGVITFGDLLIDSIKAAVKPLQSLFNMIKTTSTSMAAMAGSGGVIGRIMSFAKGFGSVLGKLFLPVTIVMSAYDAITGFVDGFKASKGDNIVSKFIDGVGGGLSKMIANLVGIPLNLLKKGVGMILGFLGFDDAKKSLESFSFVDLIKKIVKAPFNLVSKAIDYIVGIFKGENNPIEDILSGISNVAAAAKNLLKGILRSILPSPKNEDGGVMGWIKSQVSSVIPDKVYEFAGLDPETGERLLPKASEESLQAISDAGLADAYMQAKNTGDADEMERLIRESEMRKQGGAETIVNNVNNYNTKTDSRSTTITQQNLTDAAVPSGSGLQ